MVQLLPDTTVGKPEPGTDHVLDEPNGGGQTALTRAFLEAQAQQRGEAEVWKAELAAKVVEQVGTAATAAAKTAALAGAIVQVFGAGLIVAVLGSQVYEGRDLAQSEFIVVVLAGLSLMLAGPYVGKKTGDPLVNEQTIVEKAYAAAGDLDAVIAGKQALQAAVAAGSKAGQPGP